jgi:hypothetical protein
VIGIGENDLRAGFAQAARVDAFDRALRPDRHECGRIDHAMRRRERPAPGSRTGINVKRLEAEFRGCH